MSLLTPLLWALLPSQITQLVLPYLSQALPAIFPPAQKGSPSYTRNYRYAYTLIVTLYLGYSFVSTSDDGSIWDDWYILLGVGRLAEDDELRKAFRTLSRTYHPDRSSSSSSDDTFILLRKAYETLSTPTTRYIYDRFGPDILNWGIEGATGKSKGKSSRDVGIKVWIMAGLMRSCGFYIVSGGIMGVLALLGTAREGAYWRLILLLLLLISELLLILSPTPSITLTPLTLLIPSLPTQLSSFLSPLRPMIKLTTTILLLPFRNFLAKPQFLQIRILHRAFTSLSIGISQLVGIWSDNSAKNDERTWVEIMGLTRSLEMEAKTEFTNEVLPMLHGEEPFRAQEMLQSGMVEALVEKTLSSHPATRNQWHQATKRAFVVVRTQRSNDSLYPPISHHNSGIHAEQMREMELARRIALPLSPPPSPRLRAVR